MDMLCAAAHEDVPSILGHGGVVDEYGDEHNSPGSSAISIGLAPDSGSRSSIAGAGTARWARRCIACLALPAFRKLATTLNGVGKFWCTSIRVPPFSGSAGTEFLPRARHIYWIDGSPGCLAPNGDRYRLP